MAGNNFNSDPRRQAQGELDADRRYAAHQKTVDQATENAKNPAYQTPASDPNYIIPTADTVPTQILGIRRNPAAEAAANHAVFNSTVPLDINSPERIGDAATLASPAPVATPTAANQTGNAIDYNAISALREHAQQRANAATVAARAAAHGITLPAGGGVYEGALDAAAEQPFASSGANGYGTGSIAPAISPSNVSPIPSQITENGIIGSPEFDRASAHKALVKAHPELLTAGTQKNTAFINFVKERMASGMPQEQAINEAYRNGQALMSQFEPQVTGEPITASASLPPAQVAARTPKIAPTTPTHISPVTETAPAFQSSNGSAIEPGWDQVKWIGNHLIPHAKRALQSINALRGVGGAM